MRKEPSARAQLRQAISAYEAALADLHRAELLLQRAQEMHDDLTRKREEFATLDHEIASARADNLKRAMQDEDHAYLLTAEPEGFAARKIARDNLDEQIAGVRDAMPVLHSELEEARSYADKCDFNLELAREAVFVEEAERLAQDFVERLIEVRAMSHQLRFIAARQVRLRRPNSNNAPVHYGNETIRQIQMKPFVIEACRENPHGDHDLRGGMRLREKISQAVTAYWAALRTDPDATLSEETKEGLFPAGVPAALPAAAEAPLESAAE